MNRAPQPPRSNSSARARQQVRKPAASGFVAFVLHAHLPYVRHPEHPRSIEERWLFEALWQTYLPLLAMFDRFENEGVLAPISISVSPPLLAMWKDPMLRDRFVEHVFRTLRVAARALEKTPSGSLFEAPLRHFESLLEAALATFKKHQGDVLAGFLRHHLAGRLHLFTTTATHAFLPALAQTHAWVRAQVAIGKAAFHSETGIHTEGLWLPECSYSKVVGTALGAEQVAFSVLDAHGLLLARKAPRTLFVAHRDPLRSAGENIDFVVPIEPLRAPNSVTYFGRDLWAGRSVWAMDGYPSHPSYCELHRDVGFDASEDDLMGEIGPDGARLATGLRPYRITGNGSEKAPYDPHLARKQAEIHAKAFVRDRNVFFNTVTDRDRSSATGIPNSPLGTSPPPLSVAPFDAELFGHFWHEGPLFLENVLRILDEETSTGGPKAISLPDYLQAYPAAAIGEPEQCTWGEGGFSATWTGPRTGPLWRHIHHVGAMVETAVKRAPLIDGPQGAALDQAIIQTLLLQSSDFAFMIHRNTTATYAMARATQHANQARRLAEFSAQKDLTADDVAWIDSVREQTPFLRALPSDLLRSPFIER